MEKCENTRFRKPYTCRPFSVWDINRFLRKYGRSYLEREAEGKLSISCLSEASDKDAARRQVVDLAAIYNFPACSIGKLSLLFEILILEILSCPLRNRKPRRKSFALSCLSKASDGEAARRQVVDLVTAYNFAALSIGILSLLVEIFSRTFLPPPQNLPRPYFQRFESKNDLSQTV